MNIRKCTLWPLIFIVIGALMVPVSAQDDSQTVVYDNIRFTVPSTLAAETQAETIEANPITEPEEQFWYAHYPAHIRFRFLDYLDGTEFELPYLLEEPQILVYPTDSMREFGYDFLDQLNVLQVMLEERPDLSNYVGAEVDWPQRIPHLPFLPWLNSAQVLRTHPQYLEIAGVGSGIRYVTHYSQEANHILDTQIFYTFQGIVDNGTRYISAVFPVKTGVLPERYPTHTDWEEFGANYSEHYLPETFARINNLADKEFTPSLTVLDALIQSITLEAEPMP